MRIAHLNRTTRAAAISKLSRTSQATPLDVLVVGGGVSGAGIALDAASRGLSVGILEASDWAAGTSSRSSKLIHGGLRYLEMLDFPLVAEALRERDLLLTRIAPHLVTPVSFILPFTTPVADRAYVGSGVALYDTMSARLGQRRAVPVHRHLGPARAAERFPGLSAPFGGIEYFDAQVDDARFTQVLVRSAAGLGASAVNYAKVTHYLRGDSGTEAPVDSKEAEAPAGNEAEAPSVTDTRRVTGVRVRDQFTGEEFAVHARSTILATSVWTAQQQAAVGASAGASGLEVLASKGIHVTVPKDRIEAPGEVGVITRTDTSVLFIIPWGDCWIVGTTDTPWHEDVNQPVVTSSDIDRVLQNANNVLKHPLTREDVIGTFAGLRPLLQPVEATDDSTKVSREHAVVEIAPGLAAIAGGKFTTYRVMAEDAVDFALRDLYPHAESGTDDLPLLGADGASLPESRRARLRDAHGWDDARLDRLLGRYGSLLARPLDLIEADPALARPLVGAEQYTAAEVVYAVRSEGAFCLEDVLHRRLRLEFEVPDRGVAAAAQAVALVAPVLGWDEGRQVTELSAFVRLVEARRRAESAATDAEAVALLDL